MFTVDVKQQNNNNNFSSGEEMLKMGLSHHEIIVFLSFLFLSFICSVIVWPPDTINISSSEEMIKMAL